MGALLLTLSGAAACGDDKDTGDTANDSQPPMVLESEGPMPNPTTDATIPPMADPTTGTSSTGDSSTGPVPPMPPPMPDPTDTDGTVGTDGTAGSGSTTDIAPMPPPTGGVLPGDEPE